MTSTATENLLASYPRPRPVLPPEYQAIYVAEYKSNREGGRVAEGLAKRLEAWMHRRVASRPEGPLLELGAGTLNHLRFEPDLADYDIVEPFEALWVDSPRLRHIRHAHRDIANVPEDRAYRRIASIACLEHVEDLPSLVARSALLLDPAGVFQAGIPSEGGFLWGLGWRVSTGLSYRLRTGLDPGVVMRHEHLSTAPDIIGVVRHFFAEVRVSRFPFPWHHLSLYAYLEARAPRRERCKSWLEGRP